jgi:hypothetical protein
LQKTKNTKKGVFERKNFNFKLYEKCLKFSIWQNIAYALAFDFVLATPDMTKIAQEISNTDVSKGKTP